MTGFLYLVSMIGIGAVIYWIFSTERAGDPDGKSGLFRIDSENDGDL